MDSTWSVRWELSSGGGVVVESSYSSTGDPRVFVRTEPAHQVLSDSDRATIREAIVEWARKPRVGLYPDGFEIVWAED